LALDEGREVMAVPGEITSHLSHGTNQLLRLGATPVTCVADVLAAIGIEPPTVQSALLAGALGRVHDTVAAAATTANEVARSTGLPVGEVAAALMELELRGLVQEADGVYRTVGLRRR